MKKIIKTSVLFFAFLLFYSCNNGNKHVIKTINTDNNDKLESNKYSETKVDSLSKWSNNDFDIQDVKVNGDTLSFVSADWFLYYPLGKYKNMDSVRWKYPFLKFKIQSDTAEYDPSKLYRVSFKDSFVKFVKSDDTERIEIVYGNITNDEIAFINGFKVGLKKDVFFKYFFKNPVHLEKIKNVKVISALDGIWHYYHFENNMISSIVMDTDYQLYKF